MTKPSEPGPAPAARQDAERQARVAREAAALRENLRRRKQQHRARREATLPSEDGEPADPDERHQAGDCPPG